MRRFFSILIIVTVLIILINNSSTSLAKQMKKPNINSSEKVIDEYFRNNGIREHTLKNLSLREKMEILKTYVNPLEKLGITEKELDRRLLARGFSEEDLKENSLMAKALYYNSAKVTSYNTYYKSKNIKPSISASEEEINSYFLKERISMKKLSTLSLSEKKGYLKNYENPLEKLKITELELNKYLFDTGMTISDIKELSLVHRCEIYKALKKYPDNYKYLGMEVMEKEVPSDFNEINPFRYPSESNGKIKLKVPAHMSYNNMLRLVVTPSFQWLKPPLIHSGSFVYRLHDNNWRHLSTDFALFIDTINVSHLAKRSDIGLNARRFDIKEYGNHYFEGISTFVARPHSNPPDKRICVGYAQGGLSFPGLSLRNGGLGFSFNLGLNGWELTREFNMDI